MNGSRPIVDYQLIIRILRTEAAPEEEEAFLLWLDESEQHRTEFSHVRRLWDAMDRSQLPDPPDADTQWNAIARMIATDAPENRSRMHTIPDPTNASPHAPARMRGMAHRLSHSRTVKILTGSIAAVLVSVVVIWQVKEYIGSRPAPPRTAYAETVTHNGEKVIITLTDGTMVYLNSGSRLVYPLTFADSGRWVSLEGEGYFSVAHDASKPFHIQTGSVTTEVTGTEFNIRYRRDSLVIAVTEGTVNVAQQAKAAAISLHRGDAAICARNTLRSYSHVDLDHYIAWRKNRMAFTRAPLRAVMDEIERCFAVDVRFKQDSVQGKTLTGVFSTESLDGILGTIALAMDIRIQRNGKTVIIQ